MKKEKRIKLVENDLNSMSTNDFIVGDSSRLLKKF